MVVLMKTGVFRVDSRSLVWGLPAFRAFTISIFDCIMADEGVQRKIPVEDNIDWVADDPRMTPNKFEFEENYPEDLFTDIEIPGRADWEIAFEHMGLRLPLTDLEVAIFNHLKLCSSQLHPNSLAFIRAFEIVAAHLQLAPTINLFFHLFGIQRSRPRGNVTDKCGWVSLKQHKKFFDIFEESLRGFKDKWFVVRPITFEGWKSIIVRGPKLDDEGKVVLGPDGKPVEVDCERFPFCWSTKHYAREAKSFTFKKGALSKEELADLKALKILWRNSRRACGRIERTLRKLQAEKKKRQLGASSSTPNASGQSSPTPSIEVTGERRVAEEVTGGHRPPKHARVEGGGGVVSGPHRLIPGKAAAEFVIPPAMGHDCVVDGRTSMRISDADQSILASMGPESIRNVVAESSVAVFKLLEVATFMNGRECKYLRERDEARANAKDFGERLSVVEKDLSSETKALKESQAKVAQLEKDLQDAKDEEGKLKERLDELKEKLSSMTLTPTSDEEEKKIVSTVPEQFVELLECLASSQTRVEESFFA
ncbi:hypothetical protein TSUD_80030 [Trifolium subterraneum]|uniref:Transposase (putative) gypsy type domain-containing protein n=1 Tax=Trifolium subterraneum TaxID=3900 RepID=A0A2Z6MR56_TRISU|nr:hypothetical protein TSUD_80030 [Trifolium subterraneum]